MNNIRGLIIDNNFDMANFMEIVLGLAGFDCETAHSPRAALEFLACNQPGLIFLNLDIPSSDQVSELLYFIRSEPRFDHTRLIVITEYPALAQPLHSLVDLVLVNPLENGRLSRLTSRLLVMEIKPQEFRDPLTGLYNLKFFNSRLELAFERSKRRPDFTFAVLAIELFSKEDEAGAEPLSDAEWERAMSIVAVRWLAKFRPTNVFARRSKRQVLGLFEDLMHPSDVQVINGRLMDELALPLELKGRLFSLTARTGHAVNQADDIIAQQILKRALGALGRSALKTYREFEMLDKRGHPGSES